MCNVCISFSLSPPAKMHRDDKKVPLKKKKNGRSYLLPFLCVFSSIFSRFFSPCFRFVRVKPKGLRKYEARLLEIEEHAARIMTILIRVFSGISFFSGSSFDRSFRWNSRAKGRRFPSSKISYQVASSSLILPQFLERALTTTDPVPETRGFLLEVFVPSEAS